MQRAIHTAPLVPQRARARWATVRTPQCLPTAVDVAPSSLQLALEAGDRIRRLWLLCVRAPQLAEATQMPILPRTGCHQAGFAAKTLLTVCLRERDVTAQRQRAPESRLLFAMCDQLEPPTASSPK
ncbi:hypothetical protein PMIN04_012779 [Paraphaeosphaeria minitans]